MKSEFSKETRSDGRQIFDGLFGRGHGRRITIERFKSVLGLDEEAASKLFNELNSDENYVIKK